MKLTLAVPVLLLSTSAFSQTRTSAVDTAICAAGSTETWQLEACALSYKALGILDRGVRGGELPSNLDLGRLEENLLRGRVRIEDTEAFQKVDELQKMRMLIERMDRDSHGNLGKIRFRNPSRSTIKSVAPGEVLSSGTRGGGNEDSIIWLWF